MTNIFNQYLEKGFSVVPLGRLVDQILRGRSIRKRVPMGRLIAGLVMSL